MKKTKYILLIIIFSLSLLASAILTFIPQEKACGGVETTCYAVQTSQYEKTLGMHNSILGLIAFSTLLVFSLSYLKNPKKYKKQIIILGILIGSIFAIYFLYLQFFVINAICKYCMIIDIGALLSLIMVFTLKG